MQRRLANLDPTKALTEPTVIVFAGCIDKFDRYLEKLVTAIGPACQWSSEQEFCDYTGCAPVNLEDWFGHPARHPLQLRQNSIRLIDRAPSS